MSIKNKYTNKSSQSSIRALRIEIGIGKMLISHIVQPGLNSNLAILAHIVWML